MPKMIVSRVSEHGIASVQPATASGHAPLVCDVIGERARAVAAHGGS